MVAAFDDEQLVGGGHTASNRDKEIQGAERISGSLDEQHGSSQIIEDLVAELGGISTAAQWITEANERGDWFLEREMAADA